MNMNEEKVTPFKVGEEVITPEQWSGLPPDEQSLFDELYQVKMKFNTNWTDCDDVLGIIPYQNDKNREWRKMYKRVRVKSALTRASEAETVEELPEERLINPRRIRC